MARQFTQKHYNAIAGFLRDAYTEAAERDADKPDGYITPGVSLVYCRMVAAFHADSLKFDQDKFDRAAFPPRSDGPRPLEETP